MCPATELARVVVDLDHSHLVAVLLAEEHHCAEAPRLLDRRDERPHGMVLEPLLVDRMLDLLALLVAESPRMREVEAKLVRAHGRACLPHVLAEDVPERLMKEMRGGVIRHRREAHRPRI